MNTLIEILETNVWPLSFLLVTLIVMRQLREDLNPIFRGMVGTLAVESTQNSFEWMLMILTAVMASLQAIQEVAQQNHWIWLGFLAKVLQPGLGVIVAIGNRMLNRKMNPKVPTGTTNPPIAVQ